MIRALRQIFQATLVAFGLTSGAAEWTSEEAGVSFHLPSDPAWAQINDPRTDLRLVLERTDKSAAVAFRASESKAGPRILNEDFVKRWEGSQNRINPGAEKVSSEFFTFKGKLAYKASDRVSKPGVKGVKVTNTYIFWVEDDRLFEIAAFKEDADPLQDTVIKEFVDSMKFRSKSPR
jgi:hypothetical protein